MNFERKSRSSQSDAKSTHRNVYQRPLMLERLETRQVFSADFGEISFSIEDDLSQLWDDSSYDSSTDTNQHPSHGRDWSRESSMIRDVTSATRDTRSYQPFDRSIDIAARSFSSGRPTFSKFESQSNSVAAVADFHANTHYAQQTNWSSNSFYQKNDRYYNLPGRSSSSMVGEGESKTDAYSLNVPSSSYFSSMMIIVGISFDNNTTPFTRPAVLDAVSGTAFGSMSESQSGSMHQDPPSLSPLQVNSKPINDYVPKDILKPVIENNNSGFHDVPAGANNAGFVAPIGASPRGTSGPSVSSFGPSITNSVRDTAMALSPSLATTSQAIASMIGIADTTFKSIVVSPPGMESLRVNLSSNRDSQSFWNEDKSEVATPTPRGMTRLSIHESPLVSEMSSARELPKRRDNRSVFERIANPNRFADADDLNIASESWNNHDSPLPIPPRMVYLDWRENSVDGNAIGFPELKQTDYVLASTNPLRLLQIFVSANESKTPKSIDAVSTANMFEMLLLPTTQNASSPHDSLHQNGIGQNWSVQHVIAYSLAGGIVFYATLHPKRKRDQSESDQQLLYVQNRKPR